MTRNLNIFNKRNIAGRPADNKPVDAKVGAANIVRDQVE